MDPESIDLRPTGLTRLERFSPEDRARILDAFAFAKERHDGQTRIEGGPYYTHLVAVAQLLIDTFGADAEMAMAGLLHDTLEDTKTAKAELLERYGPEVTLLVDAATEVGRGDGAAPLPDKASIARATHEKVLRIAARDPRAIAIKAADRWHNLLTCAITYPSSQRRNAGEALAFHVPQLRAHGLTRQADALERVAQAVLARVQG